MKINGEWGGRERGKKCKACRRHYSLNHLLVTLGRYRSTPICVCMAADENHFFSTNHFFIMIDITECSIFSFSHLCSFQRRQFSSSSRFLNSKTDAICCSFPFIYFSYYFLAHSLDFFTFLISIASHTYIFSVLILCCLNLQSLFRA